MLHTAYFSFIKFSAQSESTVTQSCNQLAVKYGFLFVPSSLEKEICNGFAVFSFCVRKKQGIFVVEFCGGLVSEIFGTGVSVLGCSLEGLGSGVQ